MRRLFLTEEPAELQVATADGRGLAFIASLSRASAEANLALLTLTDISALNGKLLDLAERESRWNHALVSSASGVWDQRSNGELYYSNIWRSIRGLSPDDPIPPNMQEWLEFVHPQDREHVLHCIERQNAGDPEYMTFQYREWHRSGYYVWIECRGACIERGSDGKPIRIVGTDTDVTSRKVQEEWLVGLSRRLSLALDLSRIGIFETDFESGISEWDDGMRRIFELPHDDSVKVGEFWENKLHPDDRERTLAYVEKKVADLRPFTDAYRIIANDGTCRYIRSNSLPYLDQDGRLKMIGVNWDVTEDHNLHQELGRQKALAEMRNIELERMRLEAEYSAMHDYLTGLPNRRCLEANLEAWRQGKHARTHGLGILHIDLDRFKQINDTLGHGAGDAMLRHVASILTGCLKPGELAARIGGDEFVLAVNCTGDQSVLARLAEDIISAIRKPVWHEGHECRFGASIGIACSAGTDLDLPQLLQNADIALYNAKNNGRNRHEFYTPKSRTALAHAQRLENELMRALENDELVPFYQLQYDARTRRVVGAECLVRWDHPRLGMIGPDRFLATADDCGVLAQVDKIMLAKAVRDLESWRQQGFDLPKVSVNVSSKRLSDPDMAEALSLMSIRPGSVSFEILESVFLDRQDETVMRNLEALRRLEIDIEIDDFGTGHASIVGLLNLKPSTLKIDRQLIQNLPTSQEQRVLVMSIIQIARSLKIRVTAEGVETEEHARILKRLGCDVLQGFGLSRPFDVQTTTELLALDKKNAAARGPQRRHQ
ncbi:sensor domain-containing protein [Peteryoungia ipomoeae]|uniref:sensor domain-containing protein n=1 Tax=Peteryoungia ipomoeae TaxID=1210932 RepID=UPI001FE45343|nr:bifunctional diguanylate cyclase/phosphodiesterase [Peteryoungia ipomoeae]